MYLKARVPWIKIEFFLIPYNKDTDDHMPSRLEMDEVVKQAKESNRVKNTGIALFVPGPSGM